jgi:DNA-binding FadR family transcriptional regulator
MEQHSVSRAVLREAVRLLEHHQVAAMRRGPGGGLFVVEPGVESATGTLALLLERKGITPADLLELRVAVETRVVELAVERLDDEQVEVLRDTMLAEREIDPDEYAAMGHDLHAVLGNLAANPVLELLSLVLIRLTRMHLGPAPATMQPLSDAAVKAHEGIVAAVIDRDVELARHRMRSHLGALEHFVR